MHRRVGHRGGRLVLELLLLLEGLQLLGGLGDLRLVEVEAKFAIRIDNLREICNYN